MKFKLVRNYSETIFDYIKLHSAIMLAKITVKFLSDITNFDH